MQRNSLEAEKFGNMARQFLREADANFLLDEYLAGSHRMWDASAHAIMSMCQQRGWPYGDRADLDSSVWILANELRDAGMSGDALSLEAGYILACNSHINFYHRDMDLEGGNGWYFATARRVVHRFVEIILTMSESSGN